ncbi:MAG: hypothetical protein HOP03_12215 [Lysobacter sp.]|nr:hypothetical protein [Lysobacter sp.]
MPQSYRKTHASSPTSPITRQRLARSLIVLGVVATAGVALAGPAKLMRELRSRIFESDQGSVAAVGRTQPLRRAPVASRTRSTAGSTAAQASEIPMNLTYVDTSRTAYTRFRTWVDNAVAGNPGYAYEARDSALMFRITRDVKYCTHAIGMVDQQVSQAETAIAAGQNPVVAGDSYLDVGPMIGDVAMTYDTCNTRLTASQRQRWSAYAEQAIWNVWNYQSARWGTRAAPWSGWSIDNPGNNYHYSFLEATMSWALASRSATWMSFLQSDKLPKLEAYYRTIPTGGSQEGTGYGTAQMRLFNLYSLWRDATGIDLANANTHATDTIKWWTHATVPTLDRFAPLGDQSRVSVPEIYDYHRRLVLEARHLTKDATAQRIASWWLNNISVQQMGQGLNFRYDMLPPGTNGAAPTELYYHGTGTGHLFARTGWDRAAMWMTYVAGPYNESHAHQDQGAFTLFANDWLAVTENIWTHSGIQQGTEVHNTMRFERSNASIAQCTSPSNDRIVHQCADTTSTMTVTPGAGGALTVVSNLTPAYRGNPALSAWTRRLDFATRKLTVRDNFTLAAGTTAFFQVQVPVQPVISGTTVTAGKLKVRVLEPAGATITLKNWNPVDTTEFYKGWRIDIGGGTTTYLVELSEVI